MKELIYTSFWNDPNPPLYGRNHVFLTKSIYNIDKNRPFVSFMLISEWYLQLGDELAKWMKENKIEYSLEVEENRYRHHIFLVIPNNTDAIFFKLQWL